MNIRAAWKSGVTGKGVTVVHLDSGIDYNHKDLSGAYDPYISYDFADGDDDPLDDGSDRKGKSHGTSMAGLVASAANNSVCSVGVAYDVNLGTNNAKLF